MFRALAWGALLYVAAYAGLVITFFEQCGAALKSRGFSLPLCVFIRMGKGSYKY